MKFKEVEFKYSADNISLEKFHEFCRGRKPKNYILAAGPDYFYQNNKQPDSFCRFRDGRDYKQVTFKRKTSNSNNFIRTEHNINVSESTTEDMVRALVSEFDYAYNTTVFKTCFIYIYDYYTLVYYVCANEEAQEVGRFVEIEMDEGYPWVSEQEAWDGLITMEKLCKGLGISPQARVKKSLYEIFRKEK